VPDHEVRPEDRRRPAHAAEGVESHDPEPNPSGAPPDGSEGSRILGYLRAVWVSAFVFIGYSAAFFWATLRLREDEYTYPRFLIYGIWLLGSWQILSNVAMTKKTESWVRAHEIRAWWTEWHRAVYTMLAVVAFLFLIGRVGFYIAGVVFGFGLMLILRLDRVVLAAVSTAFVMGASWLLFTQFLGLRLP
jgi:hypothetical protein